MASLTDFCSARESGPPLDFPGADDTFAFGINESGTRVGAWDLLDAGGNVLAEHGFIWSNGVFTQVDFPGSADSAALGINARGDIVGEWDADITSPIGHGFVCSNGNCFSFDVPGATLTQADDINALGQIAGTYIDAGGAQHAFLAVGANFTNSTFPARWPLRRGDQFAGQISANYFNADNVRHEFLAQPVNKAKP